MTITAVELRTQDGIRLGQWSRTKSGNFGTGDGPIGLPRVLVAICTTGLGGWVHYNHEEGVGSTQIRNPKGQLTAEAARVFLAEVGPELLDQARAVEAFRVAAVIGGMDASGGEEVDHGRE